MKSTGCFGPEPGDWHPPIPAEIFLDTSIVIDLETYGEQVWDGVAIDSSLPAQQARQIDALRVLMALAERAQLAFAVSPEVVRQRRVKGGNYALDVADHWRVAREEWGIAERGLAPMTVIATLPKKDQLVLAEAFRSGCEVVLTNDLMWMTKTHRRTIAALGMRVHTPKSLLEELRPWLALWL